MKRKVKIVAALIIGVMPFNRLRIFLYRSILGYDIDYGCSIGWGNLLLAQRVVLSASAIGHFNRIQISEVHMNGAVIRKLNNLLHFNQLHMSKGCDMDSRNNLYGTMPEASSPFKQFENMILGEYSTITSHHKFDLSDEIKIGAHVVIGGYNSEFWTHGFDIAKTKKIAGIVIEDHVYIASSCILLPGVHIVSEVSVSAGTVVPRSLAKPGLYFSSKLEYREKQLLDATAATVINGQTILRQPLG